MRVTVLGGSGAWPTTTEACSGFLIEAEGFRLVVDLGFATLPRLLAYANPEDVDAVLISHGHPDHCADLNPLLRARVLAEEPAAALPVHALPGAVDAVLALDRPRMFAGAYLLREFTAGARFEVGPFSVESRLLPHFVANAGFRITAGSATVTYTGDTGPSQEVVDLARQSDVLLAEATFVERVPVDSAAYLTSAWQAAQQAAEADVGRLVLSHLWPGTDPVAAVDAAAGRFRGRVEVAMGGLTLDVG